MSSRTLPGPIGPETGDAIFAALRTVAERSFFASAERCDEASFEALAAGVPAWLVASVRFAEGESAGVMACSLPGALAERLFHAFTGRDPSEPPPAWEDVHDLVGEFANMVCGAWLSRSVSGRTFALGQPGVVRARAAAGAGALRLRLVVDDAPIAIALQMLPAPPHRARKRAAGAPTAGDGVRSGA
jgi:Chemotaxis phosphatase CheX